VPGQDKPAAHRVIPVGHGSILHLLRQPAFVAQQGAAWIAFWPVQTVLETGGAVLAERF